MAEPSKIDWADDDSDAPVENWADEASEDEKEAAPQPPRSVWGKPAAQTIPTPKVVGGEQEFPSLGAEPVRGSRQPARGGRGGASAAPRGGDSFGSSGGRGGGDRYGDREGGRGGGGYGDRPPRREDRGGDDYSSYGGGRGGGDRYEREGGRGGYDDREGGRGGYGDREGGRGGYGDREGGRGGYGDREGGRGGYDRGDREGGRGGYDRPPREQRAPPVIPEEGPWTAFVGNLNFKVEAPELEEFFLNAGCNLPREGAVRMTRDRETDRPRGIAYVDFEDAESLRKAIELDGEEFAGRAIRLDVAENKRTERQGGRRDGGGFGSAGRYDATGDDSNWRDLAKKAAEERAAAAPVERERDRESRRDDRPDRRDRRDDRDFHRGGDRGDRGDRGARPAREPLPAPTEEEEREREERKKALEEKRKQAAAANPFGDARPRDELAAQRKLQELEEKLKKQKEEEEEEKKKAAEEELKKKKAEEEQKKAAAASAPAPAAAAAKTDDKWKRDAPSTGAKGAKPAGGRGGFDWKDKGAWNADKGAKRPETGGRGRGGDRREGGRGEGPRRGESSGSSGSSSSSWGRGESPKRGEGRGPAESRGPVRKEAPAPAPAKAAAPAKAKQPAKEEKPKDNSPANAFDLLGEAEA